MKKTVSLLFMCVFALTAAATAGAQYVERMIFVKDGDTAVKVSYDGQNSEAFPASVQKEAWRWYSYEEYAEHVKLINDVNNKETGARSRSGGTNMDTCSVGSYAALINAASLGAERDIAKLNQTLADIKNGIRVSRPLTIFAKDGAGGVNDYIVGWVKFYVYSYSFKDKAGNTVDLGLHETRDSLFSALRQYYNKEIAASRLTGAEADRLYNGITHGVRNVDEMPLTEKLLKYRQLYDQYN